MAFINIFLLGIMSEKPLSSAKALWDLDNCFSTFFVSSSTFGGSFFNYLSMYF